MGPGGQGTDEQKDQNDDQDDSHAFPPLFFLEDLLRLPSTQGAGNKTPSSSAPISPFRYCIANLVAYRFPYYTPVPPYLNYRTPVLDLQELGLQHRENKRMKQLPENVGRYSISDLELNSC